MYIKVGRYELNTSEEFKTEKEAVTRFLGLFPDANLEKVKDKVKPYFNKNAKSELPAKLAETSSTGEDNPPGENIKGSREKKSSGKPGAVK